MSISKTYIQIDPCISGGFSIREANQKPNSALKTLKNIERLMATELKCKTTTTQLFKECEKNAKKIHDGYMAKSQDLSCVRRFFGRVTKKENAVKEAYARINNYAHPPRLSSLPNELIQHIASFLPTDDISKLGLVNAHGQSHAKQALLVRAREYGFKGDDHDKAKLYIKNIFNKIHSLQKKRDNLLPKEYYVFQGRWFYKKFDPEATLKKVLSISKSEKKALQSQLNKALCYHANQGSVRDVQTLLALGANPNAKNESGQTPLMKAVRHPTTMHLLLKNGAKDSINHADNKGWTVLHLAMERPLATSFEATQLLLHYGANPSLKNVEGNTALHILSKNNFSNPIPLTDLLIKSGINIDDQNHKGETPLHLAASCGNMKTLKNLISKADTTIQDNKGNSPLHLVMERPFATSFEATQLLLHYGANPSLKNVEGNTALHILSKNNFCNPIPLTALLIKSGINIDDQNHKGETPLHLAASCGDMKTLKNLILKNADTTIQDNKGNSPLHHAIVSERPNKKIKYLIQNDNDIDINLQNQRGFTAVHFAASCEKISGLKTLIDNGADINLLTNAGKSPISEAIRSRRFRTVKLLKDKGADLSSLTPHEKSYLRQYHTL